MSKFTEQNPYWRDPRLMVALGALSGVSVGPSPSIIRVAVPVPLYGSFDYLDPKDPSLGLPAVGARVKVPFGRKTYIGIVTEHGPTSDLPRSKLKPILEILDQEPLLNSEDRALLDWAASYYHHPNGEVYEAALPALLRRGHDSHWLKTAFFPSAGQGVISSRAKKQKAVYESIERSPGIDLASLRDQVDGLQPALRALLNKGLIIRKEQPVLQPTEGPWSVNPSTLSLNKHQAEAVDAIVDGVSEFGVFLLHGVTGSGKTEVYLQVLEQALKPGQQALILVPEISLTPQLVARFSERFNHELCVLHSGLSDLERLRAWQRAKAGASPCVLGTRSAVFAPLSNCAMIIVDEEHDASFKQQEGFRYSARDLSVIRAQRQGIPIVLGSATPSLETLKNVGRPHYHRLELPNRTGRGGKPTLKLIDLSRHPRQEGFSDPLLQKMDAHLAEDNQVLLFLNRRGFAPVLFCNDCGWIATCQRCDANLTLHQAIHSLRCHHCGFETQPPSNCPQCSHELKPVGQGTQRIEQFLESRFPNYPNMRIDRDSVQRNGAMEEKLDAVAKGDVRIVLGTQMLTKGHDFPNVTLVGILDADQGLFGTDFRSNERFAQTVIQVAGRAGRGDVAGEVLIQTHFPTFKRSPSTIAVDEKLEIGFLGSESLWITFLGELISMRFIKF
ncbi:MAG: primosomal protein N', partial [Pseudomonadota bacterium]